MSTEALDHSTIPSVPVNPGPEPEAEAPEKVEVETPPEQAAEAPADEAEVKPAEEKPKLDGVQKRINELTRKAREAERERDYYKALASRTAQDFTGEPNPADFDDDAAYYRALARHEARAALLETARETSEQRAQEARMAAWQERQIAAKAVMPDYDAVVTGSDVLIAPHLGEAIMESEQGPALAYHLAKNPDVATYLNGLTPVRAAIELGRIEATLAAPAAKPQSRAPAPPNILTPASANVRDPAKMSVAEYMAWRAAGG